MLTKREREALRRWYARPEVLERVRELSEQGLHEDLEAYLHRTCLMPLGQHQQLPDYLRTEEGGPLFENNLSPMVDEEKWRDAIEVGWAVIEEQLGVSHEDIHRAIATVQQDEWEAFLASVERRKTERDQ